MFKTVLCEYNNLGKRRPLCQCIVPQQQNAAGWHDRTADAVAASNDSLASAAKAVWGKECISSRTEPRPGLYMSETVCVLPGLKPSLQSDDCTRLPVVCVKSPPETQRQKRKNRNGVKLQEEYASDQKTH